MTRTGQDAANYALGRVGATYPEGYCLKFTRECFAVGSLYGSAIDAWNGADDPHPGDRFPPLAVPVYFATPSVYDHVAVHVGGGQIVTTWGTVVKLFPSIATMENDYGPYLGWAGDINGVTVYTATPDPGGDWLSFLNYDEQRRVLQAADSWNTWGPPIKENTDRLPHIHATVDLISSQVTNVTNGVLELLDALHAVQGQHARADRFSWRGLVAVILALILGVAWAVGFVVSVLDPDTLAPQAITLVQVVGGFILGALAIWLTARRGSTIPAGRHRMPDTGPPPVPPYAPEHDVTWDPTFTGPQDGN